MSRKKLLYEVLIALVLLALMLVPSIRGSKDVTYARDNEGKLVPSLTLHDLDTPDTKFAALTGSELVLVVEDAFPHAQCLEYDTFADVFHAVETARPTPRSALRLTSP